MRLALTLLLLLAVVLLLPGCQSTTRVKPAFIKIDTRRPTRTLVRTTTATAHPSAPDVHSDGLDSEAATATPAPSKPVSVSLGGETAVSSPGNQVSLTITETETVDEGTVRGLSQGSGVMARGEEINQNVVQEPQELKINGSHGKAGGISTETHLVGSSGQVGLYGLAILMVLGGGVGAVFLPMPGQKKTCLMICAGGVGVAVIGYFISAYPLLALIVVAIVGVTGAIWFIRELKGAKISDALNRVVRGVDRAPDTEAAIVKKSIADVANGATKRIVSEIKLKGTEL